MSVFGIYTTRAHAEEAVDALRAGGFRTTDISALMDAGFRMPDPLWVRIVYDFVLAYRLRTINICE